MENTKYKYEKLKVYISGYGPFMNVKNNPSQLLVDFIMKKKSEYAKELNNSCELAYKENYEVSVDYVTENVTKCHSLIDKQIHCRKKELHLLIHFGVKTSASCVNFEVLARNEIYDYINPRSRISEDGEDLYSCKLDLERFCKELSILGHKVTTSLDAGTYLCNFIYYKSSHKFCCFDNVIPLFIHIPLTDIVSTEETNQCFLDFLKLMVNKFIIRPLHEQNNI